MKGTELENFRHVCMHAIMGITGETGSVIGRNLLPVKQCGASSENECCHTDMQINSQKGATK